MIPALHVRKMPDQIVTRAELCFSLKIQRCIIKTTRAFFLLYLNA